MDYIRSRTIGIKNARLWWGLVIFFVVFGLVACATRRQPTVIAVPSPATRSIVLITEATFTSVPTRSTATRIPAIPYVMANAPTMTVSPTAAASATPTATPSPTATRWSTDPHPLQIEVMRQQSYPGSEIIFEQTLEPEETYSQYVVSYQSEGHKIYALMTVPNGAMPDTGWPVIIFNHGYVRPSEYGTTGNYVPYMKMLASNNYIVFKSDYRSHGRSDGEETVGGGYGMPDYTVDVLNAMASLRTYPDADANRIGMWGHSMGGQITLRAMVVSENIKAGVIWAGVIPPYPDIIARWDFTRNSGFFPRMTTPQSVTAQSSAGVWLQNFSGWVDEFTTKYGNPDENPAFWDTISPNNYLEELSGPIQLHHSTTDRMVPLAWSETLVEELEAIGDSAYEFYTYPDDNHNIVVNYGVAMQRTVDFFDMYVKGQ
ncbi:MAG: alpha/beta fold hydrolase [Candidatus Promineifilaceae bacterium]|nr:alpha/beta fold hydrolase [Candidatus Promineifilaceae bacterium]